MVNWKTNKQTNEQKKWTHTHTSECEKHETSVMIYFSFFFSFFLVVFITDEKIIVLFLKEQKLRNLQYLSGKKRTEPQKFSARLPSSHFQMEINLRQCKVWLPLIMTVFYFGGL